MSVKEEKKPKEKRYSYDEYRRAFCVNLEPEQEQFTVDPEDFGVKLAHEALKKVKQTIQQK